MSDGRFKPGTAGRRKVTANDVHSIRAEYAHGRTQGELCRKYGLSVGQIGRIVRGESWGGVLPSEPSTTDLMLSANRLLAVQEEAGRKGAFEKMQEAIREEKAKDADRLVNELKESGDGTAGE